MHAVSRPGGFEICHPISRHSSGNPGVCLWGLNDGIERYRAVPRGISIASDRPQTPGFPDVWRERKE